MPSLVKGYSIALWIAEKVVTLTGTLVRGHDREKKATTQPSCNDSGSLKFSPLPIKASSSEDTSTTSSVETEEFLANIKEKWDAVENKPTVLIYGGGALLALWVSSIIVGAINSVPLLPKLMELIGLGYAGWFVYRYLLFKSSRKELASDVEELKKKITGSTIE